MTTNEILTLIGLVLGMVGGYAAVTSFLLGRIAAETRKREEGDKELHSRINEVREHYVRRDDWNEHIRRLEAGQTNLHDAIAAGFERVNRRIDGLYDPTKRHESEQ